MWFARLLKSYGSKECSLAGVAERHLSIHLLPAAIELYFHFVAGPLPVQGQVQIHLFGDRAAIDACQDIAAEQDSAHSQNRRTVSAAQSRVLGRAARSYALDQQSLLHRKLQ